MEDAERRSILGQDTGSNYGKSQKSRLQQTDKRRSNFRGAVKSSINVFDEDRSTTNTHVSEMVTPMRERIQKLKIRYEGAKTPEQFMRA